MRNAQGQQDQWGFPSSLIKRLAWFIQPKQYGPDYIRDRIDSITSDQQVSTSLQRWFNLLTDKCGVTITDVQALMAVKRYLGTLAAYEVDLEGHTGDDWVVTGQYQGGVGLGGGLAIPPLIDFGVKGSNTITAARVRPQGTKEAVKTILLPFLIPAIQLVDNFIQLTLPVSLPDFGTALKLYKTGEVSQDDYKTLVNFQGIPDLFAEHVARADRTKLGTREAIQAIRRQNLDPEQEKKEVDNALKALGFLDDTERNRLAGMFDRLPSHDELLHNFNNLRYRNDIIGRFGLDVGFEDEFWQPFGKILRSQGIHKDTAQLLYWLNWRTPQGSELSKALHRLREGRVPQDQTFTHDDFAAALYKENVPEFWIERLTTLAYEPISIRYLLQVYDFGAIDYDKLVELLQDQGYNKENADLIGQALEIKRRRQLATAGFIPEAKHIIQKWKDYLVPDDKLAETLQYLGYSQDDIGLLIQERQQEETRQVTEGGIKAIEKGYISGRYNRQDAVALLDNLNLQTGGANHYLQMWDKIKEAEQHRLSAGEQVKATKDGLQNLNELAQQLFNLNYTPQAIGETLALTYFEMLQKALSQADKLTKEQQRQQDQLAKAIEQQVLKSQRSKKRQAIVELNLQKALQKAHLLALIAEEKEESRIKAAEGKKSADVVKQEAEAADWIAYQKAGLVAKQAEETAVVQSLPPE